jgi:hypothetical protein
MRVSRFRCIRPSFHSRLVGSLPVACAGAVLVLLTSIGLVAHADAQEQVGPAPPDTGMVLVGGQEGTVFKDLVVEGEDRIRIEFERPELRIDVDPQSAPGLEWGTIQDVLDRNQPDLVSPLVGFSTYDHLPRYARPWLDEFASGDIVRFQPSIEGSDRWQLTIANSRSEAVASFDGKGDPPGEITWDGRSLDGRPAPPGLTYSYVLEAFDRAGNKRSFVGEGFELPSYRLESDEGLVLLFSGRELSTVPETPAGGSSMASPVLLEVASRINQSERTEEPVQVEVTARSFEKANALAEDVVQTLRPLILGELARIQSFTTVEPDAPRDGTIQIAVPN